MLLNNFSAMKNTILLAFIIIIVGLFIKLKSTLYQRDIVRAQLASLSSQIKMQNDAMQELKIQTEKQAERMIIAEERAQKARDTYQKKAQEILDQQVDSDCTTAIKWAINKAHSL